MNRLLLALSACVLLASLVIHLLTFSAAPPPSVGLTGFMQFLVIAMSFAALFSARRAFPARRPPLTSISAIALQYREMQQENSRFLRLVPLWARVLFALLIVYVGFNFAVNLPPPDFVYLKANGGRYYQVMKNGRQMELTHGAYDARMRRQVRVFSGAWLIFSSVTTLVLAFIVPDSEKKEKLQE